MSSCKFLTNKAIICFFYPGSAGKFLLNALGLSNSCGLQDRKLFAEQIQGKLDSKKKFDILIKKCRSEVFNKNWNDLNLGDYQLLGLPPEEIHVGNFDQIDLRVKALFDLDKLYFGLTAHSVKELEEKMYLFPDSTVVVVNNYSDFVTRRFENHDLLEKWNAAKKFHWPACPVDKHDFVNLSSVIKKELYANHKELYLLCENKFGLINDYDKELVEKIENSVLPINKIFYWDCNWYNNHNDVVDGLAALYEFLGFDDFNKEYVEEFYTAWLNASNFFIKTRKVVDLGAK